MESAVNDGSVDPLTGLTDRQRLERHELMLGFVLARLREHGVLTSQDLADILNIQPLGLHQPERTT